jgi:hypothetical protein
MLLAGNSLGADGLDAFDAACVALALKDEVFSGTDMTTNPKGRSELLAAYGIGPDVSSDVRAAAEAAAGNLDASELTGQAAELAAMRAAMQPKPKPPAES